MDGSNRFLFNQRDLYAPQQEQPYQRNLIERVIAPIDAPQQFLFNVTQGVAEDGFQVRDLTGSLLKSIRYANPWSNVEPISPDEIRRTFFGKGSDDWNRVGKFSSTLAISLLYDPLLLTGLPGVKDLAAAGRELSGLDAVLGAAKSSARGLIDNVADTKWGSAVIQGLFNRNYGLPDAFVQNLDEFRQATNAYRFEAHTILKQAKKLGGKEAQDLVGMALESDAIYNARAAMKSMGPGFTNPTMEAFRGKMKEIGVDEGQFWQVFDSARKLDDVIGDGLKSVGLISQSAFDELRGKHLRRMYQAFDNPRAYLKRLEDLTSDTSVKFSLSDLQEKMKYFRTKMDKAVFEKSASSLSEGVSQGAGQFDNFSVDAIRNERYFTRNGRPQFNAENFTNDLDLWLRNNPNHTIAGVAEHVKDEMLKDVRMPDELYATLLDYVSGSFTNVGETAQKLVDVIQSRAYDPGFNWRAYNERLDLVKNRLNLPSEIREALGEITEFGPRLADEASKTGQLLETRRFFDRLAGVTRDIDGNIIERAGSEVMSATKTAQNTALLNGERFGDMNGMWTTPAVARYLNRMEGMSGLAGSEAHQVAANISRGVQATNRFFKANKIILDPLAQARNAISDVVMMDLAGITPLNMSGWIKATNSLNEFRKSGTLNFYTNIAEQAGLDLFQSTHAASELKRMSYGLSGIKTPTDGLGFMEAWMTSLRNTYNTVADPMVAGMEAREMTFKLYSFITKYDELASGMAKAGREITPDIQLNLARQAVDITEKAMFNYNEVPFMFDFARKYGVIPFVAYPVKAIPSLFDAIVNRPTRLLKYERTADTINNDFLGGNSEQVAKEIAALPEWARDGMVIKLPFDDDSGRPLYLDASYLMPWYILNDVKEIGQQDNSGGIINRNSMVMPPMLNEVLSFMSNKDNFGRDIFTPSMSAADKMGVFFNRVYKFFAPSSYPGGARAESIGRTLLSYASHDPERTDWEKLLTAGSRLYALDFNKDYALDTRADFTSQSQAQTLIDASQRPAQAGLAGLFSLGANVIASDRPQTQTNTGIQMKMNKTELATALAEIKRNQRMGPDEKRRRMLQLIEEYNQQQGDLQGQLTRLQ